MDSMQSTSSASGNPHALQRGKACLRCRKRKMRCDGAKPSCQQCSKAKKGDQCQYDDGQGKTRTQLMREHINRLEQRIRDLEDPEQNPSLFLFDPIIPSVGGSSSSSEGGSPTASVITSSNSSIFPDRPTAPYLFQYSVSPPPTTNGFSDAVQPPLELAHMMLEIFAPHRRQLGLEVDIARLHDSLTTPTVAQPHPVLMNAIYLWACFLSRPGTLSHHEGEYLKATLNSLNDALPQLQYLMDAIQASCLLALYFYSIGRITEASYHAGAATSLAIRWELYRAPANKIPTGGCFSLDACKDTSEEGQRISTFWMVYNLDRCWSTVMNRPPSIPADKTSTLLVDVPWPQPVEDYMNFSVDESVDFDTIKAFLAGSSSLMGLSVPAIRAKASALFAAAAHAASNMSISMSDLASLSPEMVPELAGLDSVVQQFLTLLPVVQVDGAMPEVKHMIIVARSLGLAALLKLAEPFATAGSPLAHQSALHAAREMVDIVRRIGDADYEFLDPVLGATWLLAATILFREMSYAQSAWALCNGVAEMRTELATILFAMTTLSQRFPILANYASQIQAGLAAI